MTAVEDPTLTCTDNLGANCVKEHADMPDVPSFDAKSLSAIDAEALIDRGEPFVLRGL